MRSWYKNNIDDGNIDKGVAKGYASGDMQRFVGVGTLIEQTMVFAGTRICRGRTGDRKSAFNVHNK